MFDLLNILGVVQKNYQVQLLDSHRFFQYSDDAHRIIIKEMTRAIDFLT